MNKKRSELKGWMLALCAVCCGPSLLMAQQAAPGTGEAKSLAAYQDMHSGIFIHYTYVGKPYEWGSTLWADGSEVKSLDELADNLDVEDLAELAASARAQYVAFTVFHANMNVLFPSKVMNQYLSGHTSRRDAVGDLIQALKARHIRTVLYFHPSDAHDLSAEENDRVGGKDALPRTRWNQFVNELMSETLERYGKDISGFFIDGGLPGYLDAARLRATIKHYDAGLWIIQNAGLNPLCADFAAREDVMKYPFPATSWLRAQIITSGWWSQKEGNVVYNPEFAYRYTVLQAAVTDRLGGGVAWSFGPYPGGRWEPGVRSFCKELGVLLDKPGLSLFGTRPGTAYITRDKQGLLETSYVATESKDGKTTYLHVFRPPRGKSLKLPPPANGKVFHSAKLFDKDRKVELVQDANGITLTLNATDPWDFLDTIIVLD
jgi:hypothetical protein